MRTAIPTNRDAVTPWYRQFWPWFLIALPGSVVIASVGMLFVALANDDSRVRDDYYKEGLAINQTLATDQAAQRLALQAAIHIDNDGHLALQLRGDLQPPAALQLQFIHPLDSQRDLTLPLDHIDGSSAIDGANYAGQLPAALDGRWYLELRDPVDASWRLRASATLSDRATPGGTEFMLRSDAASPDR